MRITFLLAVVLGLAACDASDDLPSYDLVLYDDAGAIVTTGRLTFETVVEPQATVQGTYRLEDVGITPNPSGRLQAQCFGGGATDEDILQIHLDLDVADAGVTLEGTCLAGLGDGQWSRITIAGAVPSGRYELTP